ncbi:hypothetical protein SAMN04490247_0671 [Salimicrobium halophilum]|uniref:Uncharacterized protein n=1 Tax=Salimicrobium halophilum TaxID=86666 RepID=A0A1G8QWB4_9BACI|nr:hypothetical protein SAMN04490247_0671 [Salimicrobium halophilum]
MEAILVGLAIAIVWGYFADLRNGEIGWFIGRLIFMPLFLLFTRNLSRLADSKGEK